jgi:hypothetical protein
MLPLLHRFILDNAADQHAVHINTMHYVVYKAYGARNILIQYETHDVFLGSHVAGLANFAKQHTAMHQLATMQCLSSHLQAASLSSCDRFALQDGNINGNQQQQQPDNKPSSPHSGGTGCTAAPAADCGGMLRGSSRSSDDSMAGNQVSWH